MCEIVLDENEEEPTKWISLNGMFVAFMNSQLKPFGFYKG